MSDADHRLLVRLARYHGIQPSFRDGYGQVHEASPQALRAALEALGVTLDDTTQSLTNALIEAQDFHWKTVAPPVSVAWHGTPASVRLRLPEKWAGNDLECQLDIENEKPAQWTCHLADLPTRTSRLVNGSRYAIKDIPLPDSLPMGYHHLTVSIPSEKVEYQTLIIAAPERVDGHREGEEPEYRKAQRGWGVFSPLYALHSHRSWGMGDFSDLYTLIKAVADAGGDMVATLPLLASFWGESEDISPYAPASRLFFNEFYLDPELLASIDDEQVQDWMDMNNVRDQFDQLNNNPLVDTDTFIPLKRELIQRCADAFFARGTSADKDEFQQYVNQNSLVEQYARFRAVRFDTKKPWFDWPARLLENPLTEKDGSPSAYRYHLFAQWQTSKQLGDLAQLAKKRDLLWYLDLPLGVKADGFDVYMHRESFALKASGGAPPDGFFTKGQDWGFPPLHPARLRAHHYEVFVQTLRQQFRVAKLLRIDHVMGLHRLYWVPAGHSPMHGVYVRYKTEELFALVCLEAYRHQSLVVGENLGTVPPAIEQALTRHGIDGMYVLPFQTTGNPEFPVWTPAPTTVASVNTHDLPAFASFWEGLDIADRLDLGLIDPDEVENEYNGRQDFRTHLLAFFRYRGLLAGDRSDAHAVLVACLAWLAEGPARNVLINLEDLWSEPRPQNTPGTYHERPNWRRKTTFRLETLLRFPPVQRALAVVAERRPKKA